MIRTNRWDISGETMRQLDRDLFYMEQQAEAEMWKGRFFHGPALFRGSYVCIDNLLLDILSQFLLNTIDQRTAHVVDYALHDFQRQFENLHPGLVIYEKMYPEQKPIVFKRVSRLTHRFMTVYLGPRPQDYGTALDVESHYA